MLDIFMWPSSMCCTDFCCELLFCSSLPRDEFYDFCVLERLDFLTAILFIQSHSTVPQWTLIYTHAHIHIQTLIHVTFRQSIETNTFTFAPSYTHRHVMQYTRYTGDSHVCVAKNASIDALCSYPCGCVLETVCRVVVHTNKLYHEYELETSM